MLTAEDVAYTIMQLRRGGKALPKANSSEDTKATLKATVDLWLELFKNIPLNDWQRATNTALMLTKIDGSNINLNQITPALMQAALQKVNDERMQEQQAEHEANKDITWNFDKKKARQSAKIWRWTWQKMEEVKRGERPKIVPIEPKRNQMLALGQRLGLTEKEIEDEYMMLKIFLIDCLYANSLGKPVPYGLHLDNNREICLER